MRTWMLKASIIVVLCVVIFGGAAYFSVQLFGPPKIMKRSQGAQGPVQPRIDPSIAEFEKCNKVRQSGDLAAAQAAFAEFVNDYPDSPKIGDARQALGEINIGLFFSDAPGEGKVQYVIQKGDTLSAIERKTKQPSELIMRLNKIEDPTKLRIGQVLNVSRPDFAVRINRRARVVTLQNKGKFFKEYKPGSWNAPEAKGKAPINAKVLEKTAWKAGQRVAFGAKEYAGSGHWISTSAQGFTLYTEADGTPKPPGGIGMTENDMDELSILLNRNTPVTIE